MTRIATIQLLWIPQAQFAGYLLAEHSDAGRKRGIAIRHRPMDFTIGPVEAVLTGQADFAVASPSHILESGCPNELRFLLTIQQESPLVYPVRHDSGIETVRDLAGRRVAVWPGGEDLELRWTLLRSGVNPHTVERVPTKDTPNLFLSGEVDSAQVTQYHELHQIEAGGVHRDQLRLLRARDHAAALIKDGLITSRRLVVEEPEFVQAVVDTCIEGWSRAFDDGEAAVCACLALGDGLDAITQRRQLDEIRELSLTGATHTHGLGYPDPKHVKHAARALADTGHALPLSSWDHVLDQRFWENAPAPGSMNL